MDYEIIYSRLTTYAGLAALIGTRAYPLVVPQKGASPTISYRWVSGSERLGTSGLHERRLQVTCYADDYVEVHAVAAQVRLAFERHVDNSQATKLKMARVSNEVDGYDPETKLFAVAVDILCWLL